MTKLRKWMANTAFDAAMPLGFVILFEAAPILLIVFVGALICLAVNRVMNISRTKEASHEKEMEQAGKETE